MPYLIIICYLLNLNIVRCPKLTTINTQLTLCSQFLLKDKNVFFLFNTEQKNNDIFFGYKVCHF